ncbi:MAG: Hsp33 family molecular chaperone HslO [Bacteroidetes bacterium]|nr:Hsp33 family molecular chaperone HslO [Bacteroidota bacterium]
MIEEIKDKLKNRDRVIRVLSKNGHFRAVAVKNTMAAITAQEKHKLDGLSASYLAKALSSATMLSAFLKGEERVSIEFSGDGCMNKLYAESLQVGECRGFVSYKDNIEPITNLSEILGQGTLKVTRILYNEPEPIIGIVPIQKGDISTDLAYYFAQSEQIGSGVVLDADFNENGKIIQSGGFIIQAMPDATDNELQTMENKLSEVTSLSKDFMEGLSLIDILKKYLPFDFDILKSTQVDFFCRCSKENFIAKLLLLPIDEIKDMQNRKQNELICQFCSKHYYLDNNDFNNIISAIKAKQN